MSNFDEEKDYDLDYFTSNKNKDTYESANDQEFSDNDESLDLSAFSKQNNDGVSGFEIINDDSSDEIDFSSFGKKRKELKKQEKQDIKAKVKRILKVTGKTVLSIMLIGIITGCLVIGAFAVYVFNFVDDTVHENLDELALDFTTTIYIQNSETGEYEEYQRLHGEENRIWVDFEQIPQNLKNAYVAVEDQRFYDHQGVDWKRTVGAFANMFVDLYSSNQGGSTITQQLVKNLTGDNQQSPMRKIREIMRARYLEDNYEKDTILECYLNTICLGGGVYGVEVAANYYFGKSAKDLTLVECASLAALAKHPEKYRPDKNPLNNKERRNVVLRLMKEQGYISEEVYQESIATDLVVIADESAKSINQINNYFVDALIDEVTDRLVEEYGMDEAYASRHFYNGGYKIYCTLNKDVQQALEEEYSKTSKYFYSKSKKDSSITVQSAMTIMDYEGHIVGMVGGAGEKTENRGLNRATMSYRQPGSTMKPLAAYSQALQKNIINFSSIVKDSAIPNYYGGGKEGPKNWYGYYAGDVTVAYALERSINTVPCKLVQQMGVQTTYYYASNTLGLDKLNVSEDMNLSSLGLGGTFEGITPTQSAAAFAVFGNLGTYYKPTTFTHVTDQRGTVILKQGDGKTAIDENTATIMNHLLQNVVYGDDGTGADAAKFSETMRCYAKTGTTSDVNDCWFVGGTPYYVGSCWFGYDTPEKVSPSTLAKTMWTNVMKKVHAELEPKDFVDSEFTTHRYYCAQTGLLATDACTKTKEGWYKTNYSLPAVCTAHPGNLLPEIIPEPEVDESEGGETGDSNAGTSSGETTSTQSSNSSTNNSSQSATSGASSGSAVSNNTTSSVKPN